MKNYFLALQAALVAKIPNLYVRLFNSQFADIDKGLNYSFPLPCAFIEFINVAPMPSGNGNQIYDPLQIRIHVANEILNTDGAQDQNLDIFDLKQQVYAAVNLFKTDYSGTLVRSGEQPPNNHNNIAVYPLDFVTSLYDSDLNEPIDATTTTTATEPDITITT